MKARIKKLLAILLAAAMVLSIAACGNSNTPETDATSGISAEGTVAPTEKTETAETGITFPLAEEMTFDIMIKYDGDIEAELEDCVFWQELYEKTNVKINFTCLPSDNAMGTLNALFAANQEGDAILGGGIISESDLALMAENDLLIPLDEYVDNAELMVNLNERVLAESPETRGTMTTADGHIYSLVKYEALTGRYVESPIWINKTWLAQLGKTVEDIKTIEDLEEVLLAFAENDMNGNGDATDEIPYMAKSGHAYSHLEAILGLWGISTKDNGNDHYCYVKDGKVVFAPITDAYKDALITLNRWYENGIIWSEVFTGTNETYSSKMLSDPAVVGMFTTSFVSEDMQQNYARLLPVAVNGYSPRWYVNPGVLGTKGTFSVTRSCENPEVLMKWIDQFYTLENSVRIKYSELDYGSYEMVDGKYKIIDIDPALDAINFETNPALDRLIANVPTALTAKDFEESFVLSGQNKTFMETEAEYKEYLVDEKWPRPYISPEDVTRIAELRTDIFNTIAAKRAEWITGVSDIEAEWDAFINELKNVGVDEFISILQRNYDNFTSGQN